MRIRWRLVLWTSVVVVPALAAGVLIWSKTRDLSRYQNRLEEQVRKVTGRQLTARVPLKVHFGRQPALVAEGVTLSNAPWGSRPELARVQKITMYLDPFSLFLGESKISRIVLEGADILVERNEAGDANLEMLPPPDGSGPRPSENRSLRVVSNPAFPWISNIEVRNSVLTVAEGGGRPPTVLNISSGTLKASAPNQTLQFEGHFAGPQAAPFDLTGTAGSFDGWMRGLPGNIDLQGAFGGGKIAIKGGIGVKGTNLAITGEGPDISVYGPYIQVPIPSGGPYVLNAKAATLRGNFKVEVPSLKVGNSEIAGEALFRVDRQGVPNIAVNIDAARIDAAGLKAPPAPAKDPASQERKRFLPSTPFQATWLGRSHVTVSARVGEVTGFTGKIANGSVTLVSGATRYAFRAAASIGTGSAGFDLVYDPAGRNGQATLTATGSHVSLEDLSGLLGLDLGLKDSVADFDLRLRGGGRSTEAALNAASGAIDFAIAKGTWPRDGLAGWPVETLRLLGGGDAGVPFNCIGGRFDVSGGVGYLRRLVVDTPRATIVGGGYVHPRSESWEMMLAPEARDSHGIALASPLRLKGGAGRQTTGALDAGLAKLIIGAGTVPSLAGTLNTLARQSNVNACAAMALRVDGMRPGLRAQLPTPAVETRGNRRPAVPPAKPRSGR
ncbi:MAG: AsmA family protein [Proteobacteria bacterium]|nr:AsmA family protein [Pseudomonadota bacterium]